MPHYSLKYIFLATYPLRHISISWLRRFMLVSFLAVLPLWASATTQAFGDVVAWGRNNQGQTTVPAGLSGVMAIAGGMLHTVALKSNGTVVAWGYNWYGQTTVPAGLSGVTAIAAGGYHTVALKSDGTVVAWGCNCQGEATVPAGLSGIVAIAAGANHTVALKNDGTVVAWGSNSAGQTSVPVGLSGVVAIAAAGTHTVALKGDGTVVGWGENNAGQSTVPVGLSGIVAISAGESYTVALKSDGTVIAWGYNGFGQTTVPAGLSGVTAIAAGEEHVVALKNNGTLVAWGDNTYDQTTVPAGLSGVVAIAAGAYHTIAVDNPNSNLPNSNLMGINIDAPLDWLENRLYADVIKASRDFTIPSTATPVLVDADGWPMSDFSFYVWADMRNMNGTYILSFKGQATVSGSPIGNVNLFYDSSTNTSTGTFQYTTTSSAALTLSFTGTKRTSSSASGSGVTSIKLMRPLTPGSSQSYPSSTLFTNPIKALISKFSVIRFMDFLATNSNIQTIWSDRALPSWPSFNRNPGGAYGWEGVGGPWEHVILLANETGKDAWINLPVRATDAYILNVARMFAYGSDGVNPYTSPQANPVYPPLNANIKVYVEYSNELWNTGAAFVSQFKDNCRAASDELASTSGNSPLNWDNSWNNVTFNWLGTNNGWYWYMCNRHTTKRSVEVSNIFRSVFSGDMGTRIRPVLMTQLVGPPDQSASLFDETKMMLDYYNNMGGNFVATPHPPNYYFYGAGGSGYYNPSASVSSLDALFADPGMNPAGFAPALQLDSKKVAAMGLKRVAYEGGPSLDKTGGVRDAISAQAVNDPRMTTAMVNMHNAWSNNGGELLVYLSATGDYQWGFTSDVYNLATPKLQAIDNLNAATRAPLTFGTPVPGNIASTAADACSRDWGCSPLTDSFTADGSRIVWASYSFRSSATTPWKVNLSFNNASSNASVAVYVDGTLVGAQSTTGGALSFNAGAVNPGLHGIIVRAVTGTFSLNSVAVAQN
jgi:hypothetical protein